MSKIRTRNELDEYLKQLREKKEKRLKREMKRTQKQQQIEMERTEKQRIKQEKTTLLLQRTVTVYHTRYVEKGFDESELYSKYELQNIEKLYPNEQGRINWTLFKKLVEETKNFFCHNL